jgi:hypothetical protein
MAENEYKEYMSTNVVEARKVDEAESVVTPNGIETANEGDYVVKTDGGVYVVPGDAFTENFELVKVADKKGSGK